MRASRSDAGVGCVLACEVGVLLVLTDAGSVRASYGARVLDDLAKGARAPEPGEWVTLRWWQDGPVTVEGMHAPPARSATTLAPVLPLRPRRH